MLVPVPLEVLTMLQMFRGYSEQQRSPLLEMLLPHFEEIFDEIDEESVVFTAPFTQSDFKRRETRLTYCIQGVVTVSEADSGSSLSLDQTQGNGRGEAGGGGVAAILVEWKSSPTGQTKK